MRRASDPASDARAIGELRADARGYLGAGLGLGAFGVASGVLLGAVCPVCIVATPLLLGTGVYKQLCLQKARARARARGPR